MWPPLPPLYGHTPTLPYPATPISYTLSYLFWKQQPITVTLPPRTKQKTKEVCT